MIQAQRNQGRQKVIHHNSEAAVDMLQLLNRRRLGDIKDTVQQEPAQQRPGGAQPDHRNRQGQVFVGHNTARILSADHLFRHPADRNGQQG